MDGRLATGDLLPSSRRAAEALGVARKTVIAAYDLLIAEGYVLPRPGARAAIADIPSRRAMKAGSIETHAHAKLIAPAWRVPPPRHAQAVPPPDRSFRTGMPEHRLFPHDIWRRLSARAWRQWSKQPFHYPPIEGVPALREAIARHIAFSRAVACSGSEVVVTSGAQQAFDLLARLLVVPGRTRVALESPGYPPLRQAFVAAGAQIVDIPVDDDGLRVDLVPTDARIICVTPSHQSPTGVTLSLPRRTTLLAHARAHDAVIVEDDYDGEFRYGNRPLDALQTLDRDARVFYVGTFSKSLSPAIDTGFVVVPAWARAALLAVKRLGDSHAPGPLQETLAAFIREGHLARHVRRMTGVYAERREALLEGLGGRLRRWFTPIPAQAGLHLAARIEPGPGQRRLVDTVRRHAPGVETIAEYSMQPDAPPGLIFGYAVIDADAIRLALSQLETSLLR